MPCLQLTQAQVCSALRIHSADTSRMGWLLLRRRIASHHQSAACSRQSINPPACIDHSEGAIQQEDRAVALAMISYRLECERRFKAQPRSQNTGSKKSSGRGAPVPQAASGEGIGS